MAMRTSEKRLVVVAIDADQVAACAESRRCSVAQFVALALADAMAAEQPEGEWQGEVEVDGAAYRIRCAGGLGAD